MKKYLLKEDENTLISKVINNNTCHNNNNTCHECLSQKLNSLCCSPPTKIYSVIKQNLKNLKNLHVES